ncbi:MAG: glycosyltransferase [Chloroflexi bacterium]|nr:glycosyltransferase [Chloroflexota bacterium]MCI0646634.1 glycosyltransferase [Chloroflexota bacterium]MCI0729217.1 glycosyltransferase [Chloroflexota bacterium]
MTTSNPVSEPGLSTGRRLKVAYVMSRFPKLTETFILLEMVALEALDIQIELYPLLREKSDVMHPEARLFVEKAYYAPFLSWPILLANLHFLRRRPWAYLGALSALLRGAWGSLRYFTGALGFFPKSVLFARQIAAAGVTHVHAHFASHPAAAAFVIHRLTGIPYSFTAHGSDIHRDVTMLAEKVAEADFVVPISEFNRQAILDACGGKYADKLVIIHCGVDTDFFRPEAPAGARPEADTPAILCVGTLYEVKGQKHLLAACRLLREQGIHAACHFVGNGPDRQALEQQARDSGLAGFVHFHGQQTREKVAEWLRRADVVVAPSVPSADSRREGIPVALMEAMASGVPVVASRLSGIPELVEDGVTGLLVAPGDALAIAAALARLLADPTLRQRLGAGGRAKIMRDFNLYRNATMLASRFCYQEGAT